MSLSLLVSSPSEQGDPSFQAGSARSPEYPGSTTTASALRGSLPQTDIQTVPDETTTERPASQNDHSAPSKGPVIAAKRIRKRDRYLQIVADYWLWEALALWLSCVCFAGIVIILAMHHNHPLPRWPLTITINSLLSVLAVILKSALLVPVATGIGQSKWHWFTQRPRQLADIQVYDEASRGPWGSMFMLWSIRWRDIGSLGALITIVIMAIDPFVQQVIHYEPGPQVVGNSSAIPAKRLFDSGLLNQEAHPQITDGMIAAIYQGLYFTGSSNDTFAMSALTPRPPCNSGNCTYPEFETLAACAQCADIANNLKQDWTEVEGVGAYNFSLPNGFNTGNVQGADGGHPILMTSVSHDPVRLRAGLPLVNLTSISLQAFFDSSKPDSSRPATARECMLYWCVKKFQSSITKGILQENLLVTTTEGGDDVGFLYHFKPPGSNATLNIDPGRTNTAGANESSNLLFGPYPTGQINGTFLVNKNASALVAEFFAQVLNGQATLNGFPDYTETGSNANVQRLSTAAGGIPAVFDTLAVSVTTAIRTALSIATNEDNSTIPGTEYATVTYVRVRWWWLALPVALEVGTALLLLLTIWNSARGELAMWKNSALALMFHGMKIEALTASDKVGTLVEMDEAAVQKKVVLAPLESGSGRQHLEVWGRADGYVV
ncbi:hypothetical protein K491DRAFT_695005 [Lophiostoma macrostomum CBS 122681]|uniref:Uncharacterized protein n=1 Tax=Lophiostoma macrostomum CBS 122681 TaxID=1314788 RepID=A0A6A6T1D3_9PLEO|nr:hypothetical protein K491DRAFT_695005 [Lophiostoma macrostomum CBS 122681]